MVTVTQKEIYDKLLDIERHVMTTNGKVKLNRWISSTALTLVIAIVLNMTFTAAGVAF